ncbi:Smr/MutS family protein, partial [Lysobacter sp. N42]
RIDLHGMTRQAAHGALANYIHRAADRGLRCIIVITGKGSAGGEAGVLRREVPHWLNQPDLRPRIVSFVQAQPRHGGAGALYVLLRRRRDG